MTKRPAVVFLLMLTILCAVPYTAAGAEEFIPVSTQDQLRQIAENLNGKYRLTANITLTGDWSPIGDEKNPFSGELDGGGYTVSGMRMTLSGSTVHAGLFGYFTGSIRNLVLAGAQISITSAEYAFAGGIAGAGSGEIDNCSLTVRIACENIKASVAAGGVIGRFYSGEISRCRTSGSLSVSSGGVCSAGAIAGQAAGGISCCCSLMNLSVTAESLAVAGGICGLNGARISECWFGGGISCQSVSDVNSGGIAGKNSDEVRRCHYVGRILNSAGQQLLTGGIVGDNSGGTVKSCYYLETAADHGTAQADGDILSLSAVEMKNRYAFTALEFSSVWEMGDKHPVLILPILGGTTLVLPPSYTGVGSEENPDTIEGDDILLGIRVTNPPDKTSYMAGEALDLTGLRITARYQSGKTIAVTDFVTDILPDGAGRHRITVIYAGQTAYFNVTVEETPGKDAPATKENSSEKELASIILIIMAAALLLGGLLTAGWLLSRKTKRFL